MQLGRHAGAKVIALGVQPFAFEGSARRERSIDAIATLRAEADSVLVLSHDRLTANPAAPKNVRHSFHAMHQLLAQAAQALAQVVCKRGLIQLSFADVRSLYGRYEGAEVLENCWVAHVEGDIHDTVGELIERLFNSPLLGDESIWKLVDHAIVAVSGTRDLGLSDVQEMVSAFQARLETDIAIATSASLDDEQHDRVRMTVLLAMTAPVPIPSASEKPAKSGSTARLPRVIGDTVSLSPADTAPKAGKAKPASAKGETPKIAVTEKSVPQKPAPIKTPKVVSAEQAEEEFSDEVPVEDSVLAITADEESGEEALAARRVEAKQEEMQFEGPTRGRFEKTHETIYRGENLDQPTFRRRRLAIKL